MSIPMCSICKKQTPYLTPVSVNEKWIYVCDNCHRELINKKSNSKVKEQTDDSNR
jgi:ribosome-binding protein aMBF1 (putative translation factor)